MRRNMLPADRLALLPQQDQALLRVQVGRAPRQRAAAPAGGLGVQPEQQGVQLRVVARGSSWLLECRLSGAAEITYRGRRAYQFGATRAATAHPRGH